MMYSNCCQSTIVYPAKLSFKIEEIKPLSEMQNLRISRLEGALEIYQDDIHINIALLTEITISCWKAKYCIMNES